MSTLLYFAYFQAMGFWIVPYAAVGLFLTFMAATQVMGALRWPSVAFMLALFFSLSLAVGRTAVPLPTLFAAGLWAVDAAQRVLHPPDCPASGEGCLPPDDGAVWILIPFLVQWFLIYVLLVASRLGWRTIARRAGKTA